VEYFASLSAEATAARAPSLPGPGNSITSPNISDESSVDVLKVWNVNCGSGSERSVVIFSTAAAQS